LLNLLWLDTHFEVEEKQIIADASPETFGGAKEKMSIFLINLGLCFLSIPIYNENANQLFERNMLDDANFNQSRV
jgi:hypothetical protein